MLVFVGDVTIGNEDVRGTPLCHFLPPNPKVGLLDLKSWNISHISHSFFVSLHQVSVVHAPHFGCLDLFNTFLVQVCYV